MSNSAIVAIGAAIPGIPFAAVAIVGLILSLSRRSRFPRAALWATLGFASLLLQVGASVLEQYGVAASASEVSPGNHLHGLVWITAAMYLLRLISLIALAMAIFAERPPVQQIVPRGRGAYAPER